MRAPLGGTLPRFRTPQLLATNGHPYVSRTPAPDDEAWGRLAPQGVYARIFSPALNLLLLAVVLVPTLVMIAVVGVLNWVAFGDRRKIFFKQPRAGYRNHPFQLWKFRTMRDCSTSEFESWMAGDERGRVTWFGSFLRRSHLDELPQLFNILKGEMSFIGPRPEMVEIHEWANSKIPNFHKRLNVKPGITGFAQVTQGYTGSDVQAYRRKLAADLVYLNHISLLRDIGILLVTPLWMCRLLGWQNDPASKPAGAQPTRDDGVEQPSSEEITPMGPRPERVLSRESLFEEFDPIRPT